MKKYFLVLTFILVLSISSVAFAEMSTCVLTLEGNLICKPEGEEFPQEILDTGLVFDADVNLNGPQFAGAPPPNNSDEIDDEPRCSTRYGGTVNGSPVIICKDDCPEGSMCNDCTKCEYIGVLRQQGCAPQNPGEFNEHCLEICPPGQGCEQTTCNFCMDNNKCKGWYDEGGELQQCDQNCPVGFTCNEDCDACVEA